MKKKTQPKTTPINGEWIAELVGVVGQYISFSTIDGIHREGRLTSIKVKDFIWNHKKVSLPIELELNNDSYDTVAVDRLEKLAILKIA